MRSRLERLERCEGVRVADWPANVPREPRLFVLGLLTGAFAAADCGELYVLGGATGLLGLVTVALRTLGDEHQSWLRDQRRLFPGSYPNSVVLEVGESRTPGDWADLVVEVMRRTGYLAQYEAPGDAN